MMDGGIQLEQGGFVHSYWVPEHILPSLAAGNLLLGVGWGAKS